MSSRIITLTTLFVGLVIAVAIAIQVGQGEFKTVYISTLLLFSVPILWLLGTRSWYILPFGMVAELPALPLIAGRSLSVAEFGVTVYAVVMVLAIIQKKRSFRFMFRDWWPMLLFAAWVMMIAVVNGGGFAILGAEAMGGRRYLTVLLALIGMVLLSNVPIRDKEAKRVCWVIFLSMLISGVYSAGMMLLGRGDYHGVYAFYDWQQGLSWVAVAGTFFMFARNSPSEVLKKPLLLLGYMVLLAIAIYAGKRMNFAACCVIPVVATFWHRQARFALLALMLGILAIASALVAQNSGMGLPKSMQRVLAFLPGKWDADVENSTNDIFRDTLRNWAGKSIKKNPIIGEGVALTADDYRLMYDPVYVSQIKDPDDDVQAFPHIAGKNWHSTWLGLSASFGIPCAVAWVFVQLFVLRRSWKLGHWQSMGEWPRVLSGFVFFMMVMGVMRSLSSGDVAILAMHGGLYLGLLAGLKNGLYSQGEYVTGETTVS